MTTWHDGILLGKNLQSERKTFLQAKNGGRKETRKKGNQKHTYCCNLGFDALPVGFNIIDVAHRQSVPYTDHAVSNTNGKTAWVHRGESETIDESPKGRHCPATIQS